MFKRIREIVAVSMIQEVPSKTRPTFRQPDTLTNRPIAAALEGISSSTEQHNSEMSATTAPPTVTTSRPAYEMRRLLNPDQTTPFSLPPGTGKPIGCITKYKRNSAL